MINVSHLTFDYPDKRALHDVSFTVKSGSITALVGPNGAGKTTLMRCISGLEDVLTGDITVEHLDTKSHPRDIHHVLSYLPDNFGIFEDLTVWQCLLYGAWSRDITGKEAERVSEHVLKMLELGQFKQTKASELSRGWRQRLGVGLAIIHEPEVLLLDEPAAGLDPEARADLADLLKMLQSRGTTIIVSSHILAELETYCTDMLILEHGRIAGHVGLRDLAKTATMDLHIRTLDVVETLQGVLAATPGISQVSRIDDHTIGCTLEGGDEDAAKLLKTLIENGQPIAGFTVATKSMQDIYLTTTGKRSA